MKLLATDKSSTASNIFDVEECCVDIVFLVPNRLWSIRQNSRNDVRKISIELRLNSQNAPLPNSKAALKTHRANIIPT